jgi:cysteine desulfurase
VGVIYIRKGTKLVKQMYGGHHESNKRAGTENVPGIVGFGQAAELAAENMEEENKGIKILRDRLWRGIQRNLDDVELNGHPDQRLPNTLNVSFGYVEGEAIVLNYDLQGIAVSSGSACTSGTPEPSHVLKAMGIDPIFAQGAIRFSLSRENTQEEIDRVIGCTGDIIRKLRKMSPLYQKKEKANV